MASHFHVVSALLMTAQRKYKPYGVASVSTARSKRRTGLIVLSNAVVRRRFFGVHCRPCLAATATSAPLPVDGFAACFSKKIEDIRRATADLPVPEVESRTPSMHACGGSTGRHDVSDQVMLS